MIGLTSEDQEQIEIERRFFDPGFTDEMEDDKLCVTANNNCLKIEQVMVGFIEKLLDFYRKAEDMDNQQEVLFVTYPSYASDIEIKALKTAFSIAR